MLKTPLQKKMAPVKTYNFEAFKYTHPSDNSFYKQEMLINSSEDIRHDGATILYLLNCLQFTVCMYNCLLQFPHFYKGVFGVEF